MPRMTKWMGLADSEEESTCVLCGVGCQTRLDVKWNRIMGTGPGDKKSAPNNGHMCVLGRFCIPSMVNAPDRLKAPHVRKEGEAIPVPFKIAQQVGKVRGEIADSVVTQKTKSKIVTEFPLDEEASTKVVDIIERQLKKGYPVPTNNRILIECFENYAMDVS